MEKDLLRFETVNSTLPQDYANAKYQILYTLVYKLFGDSTVEVKLELQHFHLADKFEIIKKQPEAERAIFSLDLGIPYKTDGAPSPLKT